MGPNYSVVVYLPGGLGEFVDNLRKRLSPGFAAWQSHVTILPPRPLYGSPEEAVALIREKCAGLDPFEVAMGGVATFWPVKGVVYLSFARGFERVVALHEVLNCGLLAQQELYAYVPHVTLAQELDESRTHAAIEDGSREWSRFTGDISFRVESLCLVRQTPDNCWIDLAPIPLGNLLAPFRK